MAGVVGFVSWAGGKSEIGDTELAFGGVGIRGSGREGAAGVGEEDYVISARSDFRNSRILLV